MNSEYNIAKANNASISNNVFIKHPTNCYITVTFNNKTGIFYAISDKTLENKSIVLNQLQRMWLGVALTDTVKVSFYDATITSHNEVTFIIEKNMTKNQIIIDDQMLNLIKNDLMDVPILNNMSYHSNKILFKPILENNTLKLVDNNTIIKFISTIKDINIDAEVEPTTMFKSEFNFKELGIGGLDKQFEIIFRRAFASRAIPNKICKDLGINHVRGILLYGPPGCGKTLIARQIGKVLNCEEPKIVNGPSLLSKYHGESEENVRKLFADAIADTQNKKLHLIICDEFDALAKKRGSGGSNDINDKIVNQFLTMIDGPQSLNNVLLICMTNRKDLLDDAIMRPGRLEVQIEVTLPDEKGRYDILTIHTSKMSKNGYASDLNLDEIAKLSVNFTGAEIESIVKNAVSYSISRELDPSNLANAKNIKPIIIQEDLIRGYQEIKPLFGSLSNEIGIITSREFKLYSGNYANVYHTISDIIKIQSKGKVTSILLQGDYYVGKTTLACNIMKESNLGCIKFINSEKLVNSYFKNQAIYEIFDNGYKSESFGLILDSVEKIIEYSKLGHRYNNEILQIIYTVLDKVIEKNKSVYVILTSSNPELMELLDFNKICHHTFNIDDEDNISQQFRNT